GAGAFRRAGADGGNGVQICAPQNGCLVWRDVGACPAEHMCCGGVCVSVDESNCYECGRACGGDTPSCSKMLSRCGCDIKSCPSDKICARAGDKCVTEEAPAGFDLYVSATADAGGDGSQNSPLRTITEALSMLAPPDAGMATDASAMPDVSAPSDAALARTARAVAAEAAAPTFAKRIHAEPATYDESLGERFPLVIPGGIELHGAGANRTAIVGIGKYDATADGGAYTGPFWATLVVGDRSRPTRISGFALRQPGIGPLRD